MSIGWPTRSDCVETTVTVVAADGEEASAVMIPVDPEPKT
jgi:hypothetical protein